MNMPTMDYNKCRCLYYSSLTLIIVCPLLLIAIILTAIMKDSNTSPNQNSSDAAGPVRIISRNEWMALPPTKEVEPLNLPVPQVIIAHTATENCTTQADCMSQVRSIQTFHVESRNWDDIGYNFLVGGDGAIYVGRGWDLMGAHTKGHNRNSICFAFIGTFNFIEPPKQQLDAAQKMIVEGIRLEKLTADYALYGKRQLYATQSPGTALYQIIQKWDHWINVIH